MGKRMSYDLSDSLKEIGRRFDDFDTSGVVLEGMAVRNLTATLKTLASMALDLEHEISCSRWNTMAREERTLDAATIAAEATRPGSNVILFPVIPRPLSDGLAGGAV